MHKEKRFGLGIDIGATKIAGAIVDQTGRIYEEIWESTKSDTLKNFDDQINKVIEELKRKFDGEDWWDTIPIGIGLAGTIDFNEEKIIFAPNLPILKELDLKKLKTKFKGHSVFYDNDAKCALIAELLAGEALYEKNVVLLTLGTGVGGAIAINGELYRGDNGGAGELGQMMVDWQMYSRTHGAKGTVEQLIGGRYLEELYHKSAKDLFNIIREGQDHIFFQRWIGALNATLITLEKIFQPDLIIISGSLAESSELYLSKINQNLKTPLKISKFVKRSGVVGAGLLALSGHSQNQVELN